MVTCIATFCHDENTVAHDQTLALSAKGVISMTYLYICWLLFILLH